MLPEIIRLQRHNPKQSTPTDRQTDIPKERQLTQLLLRRNRILKIIKIQHHKRIIPLQLLLHSLRRSPRHKRRRNSRTRQLRPLDPVPGLLILTRPQSLNHIPVLLSKSKKLQKTHLLWGIQSRIICFTFILHRHSCR